MMVPNGTWRSELRNTHVFVPEAYAHQPGDGSDVAVDPQRGRRQDDGEERQDAGPCAAPAQRAALGQQHGRGYVGELRFLPRFGLGAPPAVLTVTYTWPPPAGLFAVIDPAELTLTPVAGLDPKLTFVMAECSPVIVTVVPPAAGPSPGSTVPIHGSG